MSKPALVAILAGMLALGIINYSIYQKETLLKEGDVIFLQLAPVDPRSLMQGDYMALRFVMGNEIRSALAGQHDKKQPDNLAPRNGRVIVSLDANRVANFQRLGESSRAQNERVLNFRLRNGRVKFATNAFFFQEGTAPDYENARYGEFRLNNEGDLLLTDLRDESLQRLGPSGRP